MGNPISQAHASLTWFPLSDHQFSRGRAFRHPRNHQRIRTDHYRRGDVSDGHPRAVRLGETLALDVKIPPLDGGRGLTLARSADGRLPIPN